MKTNRDEGLTPTIPKECPVVLRDIMQMCWTRDPEQRPTSEYILVFLENAVSKKELKRKDLSQTANLNVI
jgi:hypothetical protein